MTFPDPSAASAKSMRRPPAFSRLLEASSPYSLDTIPRHPDAIVRRGVMRVKESAARSAGRALHADARNAIRAKGARDLCPPMCERGRTRPERGIHAGRAPKGTSVTRRRPAPSSPISGSSHTPAWVQKSPNSLIGFYSKTGQANVDGRRRVGHEAIVSQGPVAASGGLRAFGGTRLGPYVTLRSHRGDPRRGEGGAHLSPSDLDRRHAHKLCLFSAPPPQVEPPSGLRDARRDALREMAAKLGGPHDISPAGEECCTGR